MKVISKGYVEDADRTVGLRCPKCRAVVEYTFEDSIDYYWSTKVGTRIVKCPQCKEEQFRTRADRQRRLYYFLTVFVIAVWVCWSLV